MSSELATKSDRSSLRREESSLDSFCRNELFDVLGNRRRRYVIWCLHRENSPIESRELAEKIAAWEEGTDSEEVSSSLYQSIYNSLYQTHLPRLEAAGVVEFDQSQNLVYPTARMVEVELLIDSAVPRTNGQSTDRVRTVIGGAFASAATVSFFLFSGIEPYTAPLILFALLGAFILGGLVR